MVLRFDDTAGVVPAWKTCQYPALAPIAVTLSATADEPAAPGAANVRVSPAASGEAVVRVSAMGQLLGSVGSLTGLVEMLNGDGIRFNSLEAPVTMNGNQITIGPSHMAGPSLGFTASGGYDMAGDNLDIDGVVVPSYGVNSLVSNIPTHGYPENRQSSRPDRLIEDYPQG